LDISDEESIKRAVELITNEGRGLYGLINNAGIAMPPQALVEVENKWIKKNV